MKVSRHLFVLLMLVQAALFTGMARAGTINDPDIIVNGQLDTFSTNLDNNWYTFSLRADSVVLMSGEDALGGAFFAYIYASDLTYLGRLYVSPTDTSPTLTAGDYYIQFTDNRGGTFRLSSTQLIPGSGAPSPDYTAGYNAGYDAGYETGEQEGGFYVIPFSVPAK